MSWEDSFVFQGLREAYRRGDLVVFAGADVSGGLPELAKRLIPLGVGAARDAAERCFGQSKLLEVFAAMRTHLGETEFALAVEKALDSTGVPIPPLVAAIAALHPKLRGVLTTNLDGLLEKALPGEWDRFTSPPGDLAARRGYILKLRGTRSLRGTWVITKERQERFLQSREDFGPLEALFRAHPILFVGYDFTDELVDHVCSVVWTNSRDQPPTHFAILVESVAPHLRERLTNGGVRLLQHDSVQEHVAVLRALGEAAPLPPPGEPPPAVSPPVQLGAPYRPPPDFLARIAEVFSARTPQPTVTRWGCPPFGDFLHVKNTQPNIAQARIVAGVPHDIDEETLDAFVEIVVEEHRNEREIVGYDLIYEGRPAPDLLVERAARSGIVVKSFAEHQGLIDFRKYVRQQTTRLREHEVYPPRLYVPQRAVVAVGDVEHIEHDALEAGLKLLDAPLHPRFLLLLADFGTGKTFLLHQLARRLGEDERGALHPILVQMRTLERDSSLDALVAQHFRGTSMEDYDRRAFRYMLAEGRIALLLDGFDELAQRLTYDRALEQLDTIVDAAGGKAKIVMSVRAQHFASKQQLRSALAKRADRLPGARVLTLQPFDTEQVRRYLTNRLAGEKAANDRFALLEKVGALLELSKTPRMLSFVTEIEEDKLVEADEKNGTLTSAALYRLLLDRWLTAEAERAHPDGAPPGVVAQFWTSVTDLAAHFWARGESAVDLADLPDAVLRALGGVGDDPNAARHVVGSGTLLVRDEHGRFSFVHPSILEWLVAHAAAEETKRGAQPKAFAAREVSDLMADFFGALAGREHAARWAAEVLGRKPGEMAATEIEVRNALRVLRCLGTAPEGIALRGKDLRGQDLSGRDLRGADLRGANLAGARFTDANLEGATLAEAKLAHADFWGARLARADLSRADALRARFLGADLLGAKLDGARLRHAALVGAQVDEEALAKADAAGAVRAVPGQVDVATAPICAEAHCVAMSPSGAVVATGHLDGSVHLWDPSSGKPLRTLGVQEGSIWGVAFSPDERFLVTACDDHVLRLWDLASGTKQHTFAGHRKSVRGVAFSPDGRTLASVSSDCSVRLWDIVSGVYLYKLEGPESWVRSVAFSPDGGTLAATCDDMLVWLWDPRSGGLIRKLDGHEDSPQCVAFSPNGRTLASAGRDRVVRLWDVGSGARTGELVGHQGWVTGLAFFADGRMLATASQDNTVRIWDTDAGVVVHTLRGHEQSVTGLAMPPDGLTVVSVSQDRTARVWDAQAGRCLRTLKGDAERRIASMAFSLDGQVLATAFDDNTVRLWEVGSGRSLRVIREDDRGGWGTEFDAGSQGFARSRVGRTEARASRDGTVQLRTLEGGSLLLTLVPRPEGWVALRPDGRYTMGGDVSGGFWEVVGLVRFEPGELDRVGGGAGRGGAG